MATRAKHDSQPVDQPGIKRSAADYLPATHSLRAMREAVQHCRGCELYKNATQAVFGEGASHAGLMLVGEVPGDQEDKQGHVFIGPAGQLVEQALHAAGLARSDVYITNAVKHFKWEPRGKRRLHGKVSSREIAACRPWLEAEIDAVRPETILCLGATAAQTLLGRSFRLTQHFGQLIESTTRHVADFHVNILATYHPAAILRAPDPGKREVMREQFISDVKNAAATLTGVHDRS